VRHHCQKAVAPARRFHGSHRRRRREAAVDSCTYRRIRKAFGLNLRSIVRSS
jgi:hypothetical protein